MTQTPADPNRPDPQALLEQSRKEQRGRLKVFLGMAPGVGKTYAMLRAAHQKRAEGKDIAVAIVETHGRKDTKDQIGDLEILPPKILPYRGRDFEEMDIDAVLKRRPDIALVDELAHSNIEGSRHAKRYQDVQELLASGIDVYTTLNIQHLESLNDIIERITKVKVQETLPDDVLQGADEITLIDLPPDDLIQRLSDGKVYMEEQARRAMQNFFVRGNLNALREMALRKAAERVDRDVSDYRKTHAVEGIWPTKDRILVCLNYNGPTEGLVRHAARAAEAAKSPWIALYVEGPSDVSLSEKQKDRISEALSLAETMGGEAITIRGGTNVAGDILAFARSRNVARILIGRENRSGLSHFFLPSISQSVLADGNDFDITLVHIAASHVQGLGVWRNFLIFAGRSKLEDYAYATLAVAASLLLALGLQYILPVANLSLVFLLAVLYTAIRSGLWPSLYAVFVSFLTFNFFFTEPHYTLFVYHRHDIVTLVFYLAVAVLTGNLAVRLKSQIEALQVSASRNATMYDFSRKLSGALSLDDVIRDAVEGTAQSFGIQSMLLLPDAKNEDQLVIVGCEPVESRLEKIDWAAAEWAFKNDKPAGLGCDTLPAAGWLFKPLRSPRGLVGVMAVAPQGKDEQMVFDSPEQRRMLYSFCDQTALAIERAKLSIDIEESRVENETERLRSALLSSVSHDLRTPLSSIIGSATTLSYMDKSLSAQNRAELIGNILQEAERLNRFVQNLLDMTKLGYGAVEPAREWVGDIRDLLGRATTRLQKVLAHHKVEFRIDDDVANLNIDPILIEQVIVNILENAAKYSEADTRIIVSLEKKKNEVFLKISDQGQGIPPEDREKVFDMFYRVRAGDSKIAGTGLGLAICRGIVEAHGGKIWAEDGFMNKGTLIVISFPASMAKSKSFGKQEAGA